MGNLLRQMMMKRIFITGMAGTGKTSVIEELRARGFAAIDTDYGNWCELSNLAESPEWLLREDRMQQLLNGPSIAPLFVSACCSNQKKFYRFFDYKVLLSAPLEVMLDRVQQRTSNPYGKSQKDRDEICWNYEHVQPLLRKSADFEIDSTARSISETANFLAGPMSR